MLAKTINILITEVLMESYAIRAGRYISATLMTLNRSHSELTRSSIAALNLNSKQFLLKMQP